MVLDNELMMLRVVIFQIPFVAFKSIESCPMNLPQANRIFLV